MPPQPTLNDVAQHSGHPCAVLAEKLLRKTTYDAWYDFACDVLGPAALLRQLLLHVLASRVVGREVVRIEAFVRLGSVPKGRLVIDREVVVGFVWRAMRIVLGHVKEGDPTAAAKMHGSVGIT